MKTFSTIILAASLVFGAGVQAQQSSETAPSGPQSGGMSGMQQGSGQGMQGMQGMQQGQGMGNMQDMHKKMQEMHKGMNMQGQPKPDCPNAADCPATQQMPGYGGAAPAK